MQVGPQPQGFGSASSRGNRYAIEFFRADGKVLGTVPVEPDLEPAREWARLQALRGGCTPEAAAGASIDVQPLWDAEAGAPAVAGLHATLRAAGVEPVCCEIPHAYFQSLAERASERFTESGALAAGDFYRYRVCAFPIEPRARTAARGTATIETIDTPLSFEHRAIARFLERATPVGIADAEVVTAFVPANVLREAIDQARRAGNLETGGILIGDVRRSGPGGDVFVEVTALVPALHARSHAAKLVFTPETWAYVRGIIALRARGEQMVGWQHFHPNFCARCPADSRARCPFRHDVFSQDDEHVHRACFVKAHQIALLLSDHGDPDLSVACFGWRRGVIARRGFHVLSASKAPTTEPRTVAYRGASDA